MNKSLDERLVPKGEYTDALNIRISSDEDGEAGSAENAKGNELVFDPKYNGSSLTNAVCIGAIEDSESDIIYWFVTSDDVDMIVSFNTQNNSAIYHVISTTVLNFNKDYHVNGVNLVDNFLFFTDNYNQPRRINVDRSYPYPVSGVDQITEGDISVIVSPPKEAPSIKLLKKPTKNNYIEDKFIRFAYRYKYKDGEYSALSEFSDLAFDPGAFKIDYGTYDMVGMRNSANAVLLNFNTGNKDVTEIQICFKLSNSNIINVIDKYNKEELQWANNYIASIEFSNQKIYTTLTESELLRSYDNVPKKAKAQTSIGNRIMYGNYVDGYDIDTNIDYTLELINEDIGVEGLPSDSSDGVAYSSTDSTVISDSAIELDFTGVELLEGSSIFIDFGILSNSFGGDLSFQDGSEVSNEYNDNFEFILPRDYTSLADLATSPEFLSSIELTDTAGFPSTTDDGYSLSDLFYSNIQLHPSGNWEISGGGVTTSPEGFKVSYSVSTLTIQVPAVIYEDTTNPGTYAYEYFSMSSTAGEFSKISDTKSLHSNRDYEVGIVYLDEYNRASTALVCNSNTIFVGAENSQNKNYINTTINNTAPSWAKRYRFVVKPSRGAYETVYVNQYYFDSEESSWWLKLEGDNQTSFKVGDDLIVKKDSRGPTLDLVKTKVLEIETQEKYFIKNEDTEKFPPSSGLFMRIRPTNFVISSSEKEDIDLGRKTLYVPDGNLNILGIAIPASYEDPENANQYIDYDIPAGSEVRIFFKIKQNSGSYFGTENFEFDRIFTATKDYDNFYDFIIGESINFNKPTNNPELESQETPTPSAAFDSTVGTFSTYNSRKDADGTDYVFAGGRSFEDNVIGVRYATKGTSGTSDYQSFLTFRPGGRKRNSKNYEMNVHIQAFRSSGVLIFETEPERNTNEIYYESHKSYEITDNGYHTGDIQDQTSTLPAIVSLDAFNCFSFGNGVESFKIDDGLAKPGFNMGARVTAVSEQDYKESHRYADITYSGVYNEETNVNKLNEFNLGLVNFKTLEQNYGPIEVMHSRQSDILVLQEDKISYVLANGRNLFSDAQAGGAILSTPDVLGQQVARPEEYGISNNPESFANYGYDIFFTDVKRGSVINLKGSSSSNDSLSIISNAGMGSWFRDRFVDNSRSLKLGSYDPYTKEYVLSVSDEKIPQLKRSIECGSTISQESSNTPVTYNVQLSDYNGTVDLDYSVESGSINISATYNGVEVINQTVTSTGTLNINSNEYGVNEFLLTVTPNNSTYSLDIGCVKAEEVTVVRIVKNTEYMSNKTIHHEVFWEDGSKTSPVFTDSVVFEDGPVSLYETFTAPESFGIVPPEGGVVTMRYRKDITDTAEWDFDRLKYLVSDTLYTESDIETLTPLLQDAVPISNPSVGVYEASFTYSNPSNFKYLYLVWDYVEPFIECDNSLSASGNDGVYEFYIELGSNTGDTEFTFNSIGVPDRFQIEWDGNIVADSLFVGDSLPNTTYESEIDSVTSLDLYAYDGQDFIDNGTQSVDYTSADISDYNTNRPTTGDGSIGGQIGVVAGYPSGTPLASDGDVKLRFNKIYSNPTTVKVIVTGVNSNTAWSLLGISCPDGTSTPINAVASFDTNGGNETYADQIGLSPLSVTNPGTPTRGGYEFTGWSPSLPTTITSNTTFVAQWETSNVVASFDTNGGNETYADEIGEDPLDVTSPGNPTKDGYSFAGWSPQLPATISNSTTFVAQWEDIVPLPVTGLTWETTVDNPCNDTPWTITNQKLRIRYDVVDSANSNCGGSCVYRQAGTATATITVGALDVNMGLDFDGIGEKEDADYELIKFSLDGTEIANAHAPGGNLGCEMGPVVQEFTQAPPYLLEAGSVHTLYIEFDTNDALYHVGAYYEVNLSFDEIPE